MDVPRKVLIVEDHADCRETLRRVLELRGFEVDVAENGRKGVAKAIAWGPSAAVVDIGLPELDGYQVAREVRGALRENIRLIALTGYSQYQDRRQAYASGFDHFLTKPADIDELTRLLAG